MTPDAAAQAVTTQAARGAGVRVSVGEATYLAITAAVALLALILRRPDALIRPAFWADDGPFLTTALHDGARSVFESYGGYLVPIQRLLVLPETWVPIARAPLVGTGLALAATVALVAFLASRAMPGTRQQRLGVAATVVLLPSAYEMLGTLSHVEWITGGWLVALLFARVGRRWAPLVLAAALTGPFSILLTPFFVARWWRHRCEAWLVTTIAAGAIVQGIVLLSAGRPAGLAPDWALVPQVLLEQITHARMPAAALAAALVVIALGRTAPAALALALVIPVAALASSIPPTSAYLIGGGPRYFAIATVVVVAAVIHARPTTFARTLVLSIAVVSANVGFLIPPIDPLGWPGCLPSPGCVQPVAPGGLFDVRT